MGKILAKVWKISKKSITLPQKEIEYYVERGKKVYM